MKRAAQILSFFFLTLFSCRDKYVASTRYPSLGYLVVEGFIDAGGKPTHIRLSRTSALDSLSYRPETGASVTVESEDQQSFPLPADTIPGEYSALVPVSAGHQYHVHILAGGREYLSDPEPVKMTPPIDSLHWELRNDAVVIGANAHDPAGQSVYYRWHDIETWKYNARYASTLIYADGILQSRYDDRQIFTCWKTDTPSTILLGSAAQLSADVAFNQPVMDIPLSEPFNRLYNRYSLLVFQDVMTKEEYEWYSRLKKNTESLGSIFDAQPSETGGNIHSITDAGESVLGWVSCHSETSLRLFISRSQLGARILSSGYETCQIDTLNSLDPYVWGKVYGSGGLVPLNFYSVRGFTAGVLDAGADCADCRTKGGVTERPSFWTD